MFGINLTELNYIFSKEFCFHSLQPPLTTLNMTLTIYWNMVQILYLKTPMSGFYIYLYLKYTHFLKPKEL